METSNQKKIINYIENLFKDDKLSNHIIDFKFKLINQQVFFVVELNNGNIQRKYDLNINEDQLEELYLLLYLEFKDEYLDSLSKKISIYETTNLVDLENSYLVLTIKGSHNNIVRIELTNHGNQKDALDEIKIDFIKTINLQKSSRK